MFVYNCFHFQGKIIFELYAELYDYKTETVLEMFLTKRKRNRTNHNDKKLTKMAATTTNYT